MSIAIGDSPSSAASAPSGVDGARRCGSRDQRARVGLGLGARRREVVDREPTVEAEDRGDLVLVGVRALVPVPEAAGVPGVGDRDERPPRDDRELAIELRGRLRARHRRAPRARLERTEGEGPLGERRPGPPRGRRLGASDRRRLAQLRRLGRRLGRDLFGCGLTGRREQRVLQRDHGQLARGADREQPRVAIDREVVDVRVVQRLAERAPEPQVDHGAAARVGLHEQHAAPCGEPERARRQGDPVLDRTRGGRGPRLERRAAPDEHHEARTVEQRRRADQAGAGRQGPPHRPEPDLALGHTDLAPPREHERRIARDRQLAKRPEIVEPDPRWLAEPDRRRAARECGREAARVDLDGSAERAPVERPALEPCPPDGPHLVPERRERARTVHRDPPAGAVDPDHRDTALLDHRDALPVVGELEDLRDRRRHEQVERAMARCDRRIAKPAESRAFGEPTGYRCRNTNTPLRLAIARSRSPSPSRSATSNWFPTPESPSTSSLVHASAPASNLGW